MERYDLAIIGTGSGNSIVNRQFAGWRVAILEEDRFGGTCLNVGCIPTKMFVHPADLARAAAEGPGLGVLSSLDGVRWSQLRDRIFARVDRVEMEGRTFRQGQPAVDVYEAHATFVDDHTLRLANGGQISADQVVIAAGGRVDPAPIPGLEDVPFHTSDTVMHLQELPRRMTIIGGGYVAAEFAHVFSALGTEVVQVARGPLLLQQLDEDVSIRFTELAAHQWDVRLNTEAVKVVRAGESICVDLSDGSGLETDVLLMATGRVPNSDRLGLEHTSVEVEEDGVIRVDAHQRTTAEGVWALGDIANRWRLKHVSNHEARTVRHNLLHPDDLVASDHRFVPSAVFTSPQIAQVGLTSHQAREQGVANVVGTATYAKVAYGWAMEALPGDQARHFAKVLVDPDTQQLVGAHVIGPEASLLLQPLIQGMSLGATLSQMSRGQYWIHPALSEVVENALLDAGRKLHRQ